MTSIILYYERSGFICAENGALDVPFPLGLLAKILGGIGSGKGIPDATVSRCTHGGELLMHSGIEVVEVDANGGTLATNDCKTVAYPAPISLPTFTINAGTWPRSFNVA